MAKSKPVDAVPKLVALLEPLETQDRRRAIHAALMIMGEESIATPGGGGGAGNSGGASAVTSHGAGGNATAQTYFATKSPKGKVEELAVAARYREDHGDAAPSSKAQLKDVVKAVRRNFDDHNFNRDMSNAKRAGFFNTGGGSQDAHTLSYYGQQYVDTLPDRAAAKKLSRPKKRVGRRKKAAKR